MLLLRRSRIVLRRLSFSFLAFRDPSSCSFSSIFLVPSSNFSVASRSPLPHSLPTTSSVKIEKPIQIKFQELWDNGLSLEENPQQFAVVFCERSPVYSACSPVDLDQFLPLLVAKMYNMCEGFRIKDVVNVMLACQRFRIFEPEIWLLLSKQVDALFTSMNLGGGAAAASFFSSSSQESSVDFFLSTHDIGIMLSGFAKAGTCTNNVLQTLLMLAKERISESDPSILCHLLSALKRLPEQWKATKTEMIQEICDEILKKSQFFSAHQISQVLQALTGLQAYDMRVAVCLNEEIRKRPHEFFNQAIAATLSSLAKFQIHDKLVVGSLCNEICKKHMSFSPQHITDTLAALCELDVTNANAIEKLRNALKRKVFLLTPFQLSSILTSWTVIRLKNKDHDMFNRLCSHAIKTISLFSAHDLSTTLAALSKYKERHELLISHVCERILRHFDDVNELDLTTILQALFRLGGYGEVVIDVATRAIQRNLQMTPEDICNVLEIYTDKANSTKIDKTEAFVAGVCAQANAQIEQFNPRQITLFLSAKAKTSFRDDKLLARIDQEIVKRAHEFTNQSVCITLHALSQILPAVTEKNINSNMSKNSSGSFVASTVLSTPTNSTLTEGCEKLFGRALELSNEFNVKDVSFVCAALTHLNVKKYPLLNVLLSKCLSFEETDFSSVDITCIITALAKFPDFKASHLSAVLHKLYKRSHVICETFSFIRIGLLFSSFDCLSLLPPFTLIVRLCKVAKDKINSDEIRAMTNILSGLAKTKQDDLVVAELVANLCVQVGRKNFALLKSRDITYVFTALTRFDIQDHELSSRLVQETKTMIKRFEIYEISVLLQTVLVNKALREDDVLVSKLLTRASVCDLRKVDAQIITALFHAVCELGSQELLLSKLCKRGRSLSFNTQQVSSILSALEKSNHDLWDREYIFIEHLFLSLKRDFHVINPYVVTKLLRALSLFSKARGNSNFILIQKLCDSLVPRVDTLSAHVICDVLSSLSKMNIFHSILAKKLCEEVAVKVKQLRGEHIANVLTVLVKFSHNDEKLVERIISVLFEKRNTFSLEDVAKTMAAFAQLRLSNLNIEYLYENVLVREGLQGVEGEGEETVKECDLSDVLSMSRLVFSLVELGLNGQANERFLTSLCRLICKYAHESTPESISFVLSAIPRLAVPHFSVNDLVHSMNEEIIRQYKAFSLQHIAITLHALTTIAHTPLVIEKLCERARSLFNKQEHDVHFIISSLHSLLIMQECQESFYCGVAKLLENTDLTALPVDSRELLHHCKARVAKDHPLWPALFVISNAPILDWRQSASS